MANLFTLDNVSLQYPDRGKLQTVISDFSMQIEEGEFVSVIGPSGVGKTTLLAALEGFHRPSSGNIFFSGKDIYLMNKEDLSLYRNRSVGMVFQFFNLIPIISAMENAIMPARIKGESLGPVTARAREYFSEMGLSGLEDKRVDRLSGGQQQRIAIVRALINEPRAILADEPTGNLDSAASETICNLLRHINKTRGVAMVVVTHDEIIAEASDSRIVLS